MIRQALADELRDVLELAVGGALSKHRSAHLAPTIVLRDPQSRAVYMVTADAVEDLQCDMARALESVGPAGRGVA